MTRRGSRTTTTHVPRAPTTLTPTSATTPLYSDPEKERDFLLRRHQMLRRAAGFMLAKKYRTSWYAGPSAPHTESLFSKTLRMNAVPSRNATSARLKDKELSRPPTTSLGLLSTSITSSNSKSKGYTREELLNFWKDLPPMAKRALLRIRRDSYLAALDEYLVRQNLCCECHDNVIAEWEDLERRRSGSRSLQDVFSVFPPFLDDEDDDEDDEDDDDDEEDEDDDEDDEEDDEEEDEEEEGDDRDGEDDELETDRCRHRHHGRIHHHDEYDDEFLDGDDGLIDDDDEEVVFKYELEAEEFRRAAGALGNSASRDGGGDGGLLSDEYLAALEVGKRQEDELLRLIQKEERYIIIREDHSEFIMDLIRCGEQFSSYVAALRPAPSYDGYEDEDYDDAECPGANTAHLAQEYLLEVLAIKFREQLESAYQAALQHSLAVQAELLREEIAELQRDQKQQQQQPATTSTKSKKKKDKKKKKKKTAETKASSNGGGNNQSNNASRAKSSSSRSTDNQTDSSTPETSPTKSEVAANRRGRSVSAPTTATKKARSNQVEDSYGNNQEEDYEEDDDSDDEADFNDVEAVDREVEAFRVLLEKINAQHKQSKSKPKLVLPPGAFSMLT